MTTAALIRAASSRWLRANEWRAKAIIDLHGEAGLKQLGWSAVQINNMLTYLSLVEE